MSFVIFMAETISCMLALDVLLLLLYPFADETPRIIFHPFMRDFATSGVFN